VVVEDFGRRIGRERTAAEVVNPALRHDPYPVTGQLHAPAEVDLLHVGEKVGVKAAQRMENIGPAAECGAADPENVAGVVVLALVGLDLSEDAPPAERIAEKVDKSARSTCIFEFRAVGP